VPEGGGECHAEHAFSEEVISEFFPFSRIHAVVKLRN